jgi:hypothetical protein
MGIRFECDLSDYMARNIYYGDLHPSDSLLLSRIVKPGQVILDAGANLGYFSLVFARWLQGQGAVHAFEPFPPTAVRLDRNLGLNPRLAELVHVHRLALSDHVGSVSMVIPDSNHSGANFHLL